MRPTPRIGPNAPAGLEIPGPAPQLASARPSRVPGSCCRATTWARELRGGPGHDRRRPGPELRAQSGPAPTPGPDAAWGASPRSPAVGPSLVSAPRACPTWHLAPGASCLAYSRQPRPLVRQPRRPQARSRYGTEATPERERPQDPHAPPRVRRAERAGRPRAPRASARGAVRGGRPCPLCAPAPHPLALRAGPPRCDACPAALPVRACFSPSPESASSGGGRQPQPSPGALHAGRSLGTGGPRSRAAKAWRSAFASPATPSRRRPLPASPHGYPAAAESLGRSPLNREARARYVPRCAARSTAHPLPPTSPVLLAEVGRVASRRRAARRGCSTHTKSASVRPPGSSTEVSAPPGTPAPALVGGPGGAPPTATQELASAEVRLRPPEPMLHVKHLESLPGALGPRRVSWLVPPGAAQRCRVPKARAGAAPHLQEGRRRPPATPSCT